MRVFIRNQLVELLKTILEAAQYMYKLGADAGVDIEDCYAAILEINSYMLEEKEVVCYATYELKYIDVLNYMERCRQDTTDKRNYLKLVEAIEGVIEVVKNFPVKLEVVFLPYKLCMWDSMESVWRASKADERCEVYVVPIPYYDKLSNGGLGTFHYEGAEYNKEVDIVHYNEYDFERRQPDIIYIHNPYDNGNRLTTIMPRFYSDRLRCCTNMLVYLPYDISAMNENKSYINAWCSYPGIRNADRLILQSERQQEIIAKFADKNIAGKGLVLGNPKIDGVFYDLSHHPVLSEEWREIIKDRKVLLVNLSIGSILEGADILLDYEYVIRSVLAQNEFAIIWRPHPLLQQTIETMRPDVRNGYEQLLSILKNSKDVIIDTNKEASTAFFYSDALITDYSSIVFKYLATKKPVYFMNVNPKCYDLTTEVFNVKDRIIDYYGCYFMLYDEEVYWHRKAQLGDEHSWEECKNDLDKLKVAYSNQHIELITVGEFLDIVNNDRDWLKERRLEKYEGSLVNVDGKCGQEICKAIVKAVLRNNEIQKNDI